MHVLDTLIARGFVQQSTDAGALRQALTGGPQTFYVGFDPTGDSLHVGHLLPVMAMAHLQRAGHRPIIVLGGGTAMVGDPSGKDKTREIITEDQIRPTPSWCAVMSPAGRGCGRPSTRTSTPAPR